MMFARETEREREARRVGPLPSRPVLQRTPGKPTPREPWLQPATAAGSPVAALGPADPGPLGGDAAASVRQKQNPCIMNKFHVQHFKCLFVSPDN